MALPTIEAAPTHQVTGPVICDGCGEPFITGELRIEDGVIVNSCCADCRTKWFKEYHAEGT